MYKCNSTSSEVKIHGCPEWDPKMSWNKLYTTPAGWCSTNEKCATGTFKGGLNRGTSWAYTYFFGDNNNPRNNDPDNGGHGYLTIDYCNAATDWVNTDPSGHLIFKTVNSNSAKWCKHSGTQTSKIGYVLQAAQGTMVSLRLVSLLLLMMVRMIRLVGTASRQMDIHICVKS